MPVDLDSSATFEDLILRLAARTGHADQTGTIAELPTDAEVLRLHKAAVNEGYDRFLRANPKWTFLDLSVTITLDSDGDGPTNIDGDAGRYIAPGYVSGAPTGPWVFADTRSRRTMLKSVHPSQIDAYRQAGSGQTGAPSLAACRSRRTGAPVGQAPAGWEFMFWPLPDQDYVLSAPFRVKKHVMVELGEKHVAGSEHDSAIHAFAAWAWYEDDAEDPAVAERFRAAAMERLAESMALDLQNFPDSVGDNDGGVCPENVYRLPRVYAHNGNPIAYD